MNDIIRKRKSIRKYDMTELDAATLEMVLEQIDCITPLYPDIRYSIEIAEKTKGIFGVKAPHYLIFRSEKMDGANENIGFIGQQMSLFFTESGLGSCWLGMAKPEENKSSALPFVISIAFGKPAEPLYRKESEFKRKTLTEISEGTDRRLEAARLAPSGMNAQKWYFVANSRKIHCYIKSRSTGWPSFSPVTGKLVLIDIGIAICHIMEEGNGFSFSKDPAAPMRKNCAYIGTVM